MTLDTYRPVWGVWKDVVYVIKHGNKCPSRLSSANPPNGISHSKSRSRFVLGSKKKNVFSQWLMKVSNILILVILNNSTTWNCLLTHDWWIFWETPLFRQKSYIVRTDSHVGLPKKKIELYLKPFTLWQVCRKCDVACATAAQVVLSVWKVGWLIILDFPGMDDYLG